MKRSKDNPNILLISIDSLRADHLSTYGYHRETSPYLSEFATDAVTFENAYTAANWTGASITSILTGLYPTCHGYTNKHYFFDNGEDSLASILKQNGYFTICFSNNLYFSGRTGLDAGFDDFRYRGRRESVSGEQKRSALKMIKEKIKQIPSMRSKQLVKNVIDSLNREKALHRDDGAYDTEAAFTKWMGKRDSDKPFFAYIHYQEPHSVYFPPYPYRRRFFSGSWLAEGALLHFDHMRYYGGKTRFTESQVRGYKELYDGEICYLDWRLGRLYDLLKAQNQLDRTIVIVTADHGEMFGEKGFFWHAFCLYQPLIRVPLIIRYPEWFGRDVRSLEIVQTNDLVPTLLEGLDIEWKYAENQQGQSFLNGSKRAAALTETYNPQHIVERWVHRNKDLQQEDFKHFLRDIRSYQTVDSKLIVGSDGQKEFYDLQRDPQETTDLYNSADENIAAMEKALDEWVGSFKPHSVAEGTQPGFDKTTWEKMKALGYA